VRPVGHAALESRRRQRRDHAGEELWMAGYASRNKPAEGKETDLYGKALAIETGGVRVSSSSRLTSSRAA